MKGPLPALVKDRINGSQGQGQAGHNFESFPCSFPEMLFLSSSRQTSQGQALPVPSPPCCGRHTPHPISQGSWRAEEEAASIHRPPRDPHFPVLRTTLASPPPLPPTPAQSRLGGGGGQGHCPSITCAAGSTSCSRQGQGQAGRPPMWAGQRVCRGVCQTTCSQTGLGHRRGSVRETTAAWGQRALSAWPGCPDLCSGCAWPVGSLRRLG